MFSFAMITFFIRADVIAVLEALLEDEEPLFKVEKETFQCEF